MPVKTLVLAAQAATLVGLFALLSSGSASALETVEPQSGLANAVERNGTQPTGNVQVPSASALSAKAATRTERDSLTKHAQVDRQLRALTALGRRDCIGPCRRPVLMLGIAF